MDRALRIALDEGLQAEAGRAYSNYYATHCSQRQFAAAEQLFADGIAYCDDHDITTYGTFLRSERTGMLEKTGRWDEALALCQDILDRAAPAPVTRLCPTTRAGTLMARRGEATAWEYPDQAMADADRTDLDCPYEAALVQLDAAEEGALREALSIFTELGASAVARLTRRRPPPRPPNSACSRSALRLAPRRRVR